MGMPWGKREGKAVKEKRRESYRGGWGEKS